MTTSRSHITIIADRTGSMSALRVEAEASLNTFIAEQVMAPGKARLLLADFDDRDTFRIVHDGKIVDCPPYALDPRGMTPLHDAIGKAIVETATRVTDRKFDHVFVVILTDGQENASREYTGPAVESMIAEREAEGWTFVFLAAGREATVAAKASYAGTQMIRQNTMSHAGNAHSHTVANTRTSDNISATRGGAKGMSYGGTVDADGNVTS